ncbi:MAG: hypothetical protein KZQ99_13800 [Candidatus Thiodiazotropha sp. (ex Dulcina madagascariensis)]|nr:hypothetical protein [Candidatus Thiodiazotropha sp. (ex Dulcina madagascariensis)]
MRATVYLLVGLIALFATAEADVREAHTLSTLVSAPPCERYLMPTDRELAQARKLFTSMLSDAGDADALSAQWASLGFEWLAVEWQGMDGVILKEQPSRCEGRGLFLFRTDTGSRTLLQIPHRFYDKYTGEIGHRLMQTGDFRGVAWNTVHRYLEGAEGGSADLAHNGDNYFTVLAEAAALLSTNNRIVQLHGFDGTKRRTPAGRGSQAIVSDGTRRPSRIVRELANCLGQVFDGPVRLFPRDVKELGATTNRIGARLRAYAHQGFAHIELNAEARQALLADEMLMTGLAACLPGARE